ncbi:MAG: hypothetical protein QMD71_05910 [bacterium]|nr:hypothetical protein [bacterium]
MGILNKLMLLERKYIFIIVALCVIIPLLIYLGLPIGVTKPALDLYNEVDCISPDGDPLLISFDFDPSTQPELYPMGLAILRHCFAKNIRVILMSLYVQGAGLAAMAIEDVRKEFTDKKSGVDYTFLGYQPGASMVVLGIGEDIHKIFPRDYYGVDIDSLPMMQTVKNYNDIPFVVFLTGAGTPWIVYANTRYHQKVGGGVTAVMASSFYPYLQTGQLTGMLGGLKGAAEYEELLARNNLSNARRIATIGMDAQSIVHIMMIVFIIFGNVAYFIVRKGRRK